MIEKYRESKRDNFKKQVTAVEIFEKNVKYFTLGEVHKIGDSLTVDNPKFVNKLAKDLHSFKWSKVYLVEKS
ncbi:hypothetical protein PRVXT_001816 [Proteinivorax tanatarense]|uniref:Uncharacterized protein n=1 Tax=Proteinivorax tanatarense TaxID=1260629 RepID=A0AAU7VIY6_9FIRM